MYSVIPVFIYQGMIALFATQIERMVPESFLNGLIVEITSVGGITIVAIGLNLLKLVHIRIGNLLPAILTVVLIYYLYSLFWRYVSVSICRGCCASVAGVESLWIR